MHPWPPLYALNFFCTIIIIKFIIIQTLFKCKYLCKITYEIYNLVIVNNLDRALECLTVDKHNTDTTVEDPAARTIVSSKGIIWGLPPASLLAS